MKSTMQDAPLLISDILRHGLQTHGDSEVITIEAGGHRTATFKEVAARAEKLAAALQRIGVQDGDRVGTFCWNNQGHLEAYLAIPCMGAVLHTLNIRLPAEQLAYVINHAEDKVIIVDGSLIPLLAAIKDELKTVETIIVAGDGDASALGETLSYETLLAAEEPGFEWPVLDERSAAAMCYTSGTTGNPKGVVYSHRSTWLHAMAEQAASSVGMTEKDRILIIVPMFHANAWGTPYGAWMAGTDMIMPQMFLMGEQLGEHLQRVPPDAGLRCAHHLERPAPARQAGRFLLRARHLLGRGRGAAVIDRRLRGAVRGDHYPGMGHDRDQPAGRVRAPARPRSMATTTCTTRSRRAGSSPASRSAWWPRTAPCCPTTASPSASSRCAGPGSPARTTRTRIPTRFQDGWLRTGDVGCLDEQGYMTISDRTKDVIKSGGEWISSVELENAVMGYPGRLRGGGDRRARPQVVGAPAGGRGPQAGHDAGPGGAGRLPGRPGPRWWLPDQWTFIDEIPKTSVGKFDKKVMRAAFAEGDYSVQTVDLPK